MNENPAHSSPRIIFGYILVVFYLVVRFGFTQQLDAFGTYASYFFEVFCVLLAIVLFDQKIFPVGGFSRSEVFGVALSFGAGFGVFRLAMALNIAVPFNLKGTETVLTLLVLAPVLEEAIFRFLVWRPVQNLSRRPLVALLSTSLIFAYSHFHAIWFVPLEMYKFVIYQTMYTLLLGLACGTSMYRRSALASPILIHFAFNFGFYLAS